MSEIKYTIERDIITGDRRIEWSNVFHLYKYAPAICSDLPAKYYRMAGLSKPKPPKQEWKIVWDFNMKQNSACLHFRYEGIKQLSQKDVVYLVSSKPFESALHDAYAEQRVRGECFNLSEMDIEMLKESLS